MTGPNVTGFLAGIGTVVSMAGLVDVTGSGVKTAAGSGFSAGLVNLGKATDQGMGRGTDGASAR